MKKLSYLFAVAASAACLCACTDVTDVLPAEQIPADARSTLGADVVLQWNNEEQTIDGFGVAQAGWSDYLYAHRKRQEIMDVMFGQDGLRLSILRGEVFPHYDETTFNMDEDINLSLDDPFFDIDFNRDENRVAEGIAQRNGQLWIMKKAKQEYLTEDEIKTVMTHEFSNRKLAYIRDLFVFASFTALSFVDIKELTTDDIAEVNGEKWILSKRHKTKVNFQVKLLDIPLQIIKRYERFQENGFVFPDLNYWSICKPLKQMIRECGITKNISFHSSRHGFATLALSKGVPIESVSRVLGHTNIVTTQKYCKITTEKIDKDLTMFGDCLNRSFHEISITM